MKPVCWWCCHPFEWESLHFPYKLKSNVFYTTGHFCTWECMKAYAIDRNFTGQCEYITLMRKRMEGKISQTKKAPNKYTLEMFGGTLSIDEFRNLDSSKVNIKIPGEAYQIQTVNVQQNNTTIGNDGLKLKREKPLERAKGKLETSLNVTVRKCHQPRVVA
jgi:hypothetical protein